MSEDQKQGQAVAERPEAALNTEETAIAVPEAAVETAAPKRNKYADKMNKKKKKKGGKKLRVALGVLVVAGLVGGGIYLVQRTRNHGDEGGAEATAVAMRGMLETYIEGEGQTAAKKREELGKELKGTVTDVRVEVGDEVKEGDELLVVNPTETRKELDTAEEELSDAQRAVSDAQAEVSSAQSKVNTARKNLSKLNVTAPFTGKIVPVKDGDGAESNFKVGQQISQGTVIGSMVDDGKMRLPLYFSYAYVKDIKSGQSATVSIPSAMSETAGKVDSVEAVQKISADGVTLFRVVVVLDNPGTLTKGMMATATVSTGAGVLYPAESGTLEYNREEEITAQVSGEIASVNGIEYYKYSGGQTIMRLTSDSAQDEVKQAQNAVTSAQNAVVNAQKTVKGKQDRIKELKEIIKNATVISPIDGMVVSLPAMVDQEVNGSGALCVVADMTDIVVNANITATDVSAVQPGQMAQITMYTNEGEAMFTGTVQSVSMEASQDQNNSQGSMPTFPAVIAMDPMEGQVLRPDYPVQYKITTAQAMDCITVPSAAIVNTEDGTAVFAQPMEGQEFADALPIPEGAEVPEGFFLVPVEVGIADSTNTEILWGIDEGTVVYLAVEDMYANQGGELGGTAAAVG